MKKLSLTLFFLIISIFSFAQIEYYENPNGSKDTSKFEHKLNYGFDFGLSFGYITYLGSSAQIAYPITNYNSIGLGVNFTYTKVTNYEKNIIYGASLFDEFYILNKLIVHSEIQFLNQNDNMFINRIWNYGLYLGPGFKQNISKKSYATYLVLWDFNYNDNSVFSNPLFRISFYF